MLSFVERVSIACSQTVTSARIVQSVFYTAKVLVAAVLIFAVLRRAVRFLTRAARPAMPRYDRFQQHGNLAPYLEEHPGLFGFYKHSQFPTPPLPDRSTMLGPLPVPRLWTSKERRERGERHREQAIVWLDVPFTPLPDSPPEVVSSPSSSLSPSPSTWYSPPTGPSLLPTAFVPRQTPCAPLSKRVATVEERIHSAAVAEQRRKLRRSDGPRFIREDEAQEQLARERERAKDPPRRAWRPPTPDPRAARLATFAERAQAIQAEEKEREERRQRRREERTDSVRGSNKHNRKRGYESSPQTSKQRPQRTCRSPPAQRSRRTPSPPPPVPPLRSYFSPPTPVSPQRTAPPQNVPAAQRYPSRANNPACHASALPPAPGPRLERKNAIKRSSRFFQAPPKLQTPAETPLPELSRFDRLLETISKLTLASSMHLAPSHSHIYSGTLLPTLPHDIHMKMTDLYAYLRLSPTTLLPDQDSPAARWASPFRLFPHIRAPDNLAGFDGLALHPPAAARGRDPMDARWRVMQRFAREPDTQPRRQYLPSLIALITVLELVKHLRACTARRAADWVAGADAARRTGEQQREAETRAAQHQASKHDHAYRHRLRRKTGHRDLNIPSRAAAPDPTSSALHNANQQPIPLPPPLSARMRKLERVETRLRWQVALVGEALWGKGSLQGLDAQRPHTGGRVGGVPARVRALTQALGYEGFLVEYDWQRGTDQGDRRR